jgi:hypothetical protein
MPAFTGGPHAGQTSIRAVTVDNGSTDPFSESYFNTDTVSLGVTIGSSSASFPAPFSFYGAVVYITTDALGTPTLDLSADFNSYVFRSGVGTLIQLRTNPYLYAVQLPGDSTYSYNLSDIVVTGAPLNAVPEPGTLGLIGSGGAALLLLGLWRRRAGSLQPHRRPLFLGTRHRSSPPASRPLTALAAFSVSGMHAVGCADRRAGGWHLRGRRFDSAGLHHPPRHPEQDLLRPSARQAGARSRRYDGAVAPPASARQDR